MHRARGPTHDPDHLSPPSVSLSLSLQSRARVSHDLLSLEIVTAVCPSPPLSEDFILEGDATEAAGGNLPSWLMISFSCDRLDSRLLEMNWLFVQENDDRAVPGVTGKQGETCADDSLPSEPWSQWISTETRLGTSDGNSFTPSESVTEEMRTDVQTTWPLSSPTCINYYRKQNIDDNSQISCGTKEDAANDGDFKWQESNMDSYDQEINADLLSPPSSDLLFMNCEEDLSALHECGFFGEKNNYQFDDLSQNDGIFQNLMLGGNLPDNGDQLSFPYMSPTAEESSVQFEDFLSDMLVDSSNPVKDSSTFEALYCSDNQLKVCGKVFSNQDNNSASCSIIVDNLPTRQRQMLSASVPVDPGMLCEEETKVDEEGSLEATILRDLELSVSQQLNTKTRICFRDALYRLARSSRQQHAANQAQIPKIIVDMPASACNNGARESQTNVIDRTVASMLFNRMSQDPPECLSPTHLDKKHIQRNISSRKSRPKKRQSADSLMSRNEDPE